MNDKSALQPLIDELAWQRDQGRQVRFWLRDDDAVIPTVALNRFIALTKEFQVPACLAVIPHNTGKELSMYLNNESHVSVSVHGWAHENHAHNDEKKQELGSHRPASAVISELDRGYEYLQQLYDEQFVPLLVPPWNRIADDVVQGLPEIGFQALSTFGPEKLSNIRLINTHVDLIDWKGTRGGRTTVDLVADLVKAIQKIETPIGFLTHHLVHDEIAWRFMEQLFEVTANNEACQWESIAEII